MIHIISPRLSKGSFHVIDPLDSSLLNIINFQYNPTSIIRNLTPEWKDDGSLYVAGTPKETINISIELDSTDQLEKADPTTAEFGVHPALSALELLVYPTCEMIVGKSHLDEEKIYYKVPLVLFTWGKNRAIPVQIMSLNVVEQEHDPQLNPIRAIVSLNMNVLDYRNFTVDQPGYKYFMAYHRSKEQMAVR